MKRLPGLREIYKGVRKPVPPPTRVREDKREKIRRRSDQKDVEEYGRTGDKDREE